MGWGNLKVWEEDEWASKDDGIQGRGMNFTMIHPFAYLRSQD